ncbi:NSE3 protein, partial [Drymodes brunneopygia]|nr:NSE3 protein [Drymodes brunneopygia]
VSELVQFLLVKDQKKIPIKRTDMKHLVQDYKGAYTEIMNKAGRTLQEVFGLQLVEIDSKRHTYILINNLPQAEGQYLCRDKEKMGLLLVILSFIFMKGNSVKDTSREPSGGWGTLDTPLGTPQNPLGHPKTPSHLYRYLEITPIPLTDPPEYKYQWGPRAEKETSKKDVLNFVAKVRE